MRPEDLHIVPLFRDIDDKRLEELLAAFEKGTFKPGHVLFRAGDAPARFLLLAKGEVSVEEPDGAYNKFLLRGVAPIGELGSLTGLARSATATVASEAQILSITVPQLMGFFTKNAEIAFPFYRNLLALVTEKVNRDRRRTDEMRTNLIRTQKAMKKLRELVLASAETELSKPVFEVLDDMIENNRRAHYRVSPVAEFPAHVRLDDGAKAEVLEISDGYLKLSGKADRITKDRSFWAGVLALPAGEILVSGSVLREGHDGVVVKLDTLIDEYKSKLDDYVTKLQLLDFVV